MKQTGKLLNCIVPVYYGNGAGTSRMRVFILLQKLEKSQRSRQEIVNVPSGFIVNGSQT